MSLTIIKIEAYQVDLTLREGSYKCSGGKSAEVFDSRVVAVHMDAGITRLWASLPTRPGLSARLCSWDVPAHVSASV
jgi:hypothetical protein